MAEPTTAITFPVHSFTNKKPLKRLGLPQT